MLIRKSSDIPSSEITDKSDWEDRRVFIKQAMAMGIGLTGVVAGGAGIAATARKYENHGLKAIENIQPSDYGQALELTSYKHVTTYNNFYEFGTGKGDPVKNSTKFQALPWKIAIDGECERPGEIDFEDMLSKFPQEERIYRFRCVEAWAMVVPWVGFSLASLLKQFKPTSKAKYVVFETLYDPKRMPGQQRQVLDWPYTEALRIDEAMHPLTLMTTGLYGEVLPNQNGAPIRLVIPWKYGFKSIKSIVRIRFTENRPATTWSNAASHEYGFYANVNPTVDHPRWTQKTHRMVGAGLFSGRKETLMFNGYADQVADLYRGMDLRKEF